MCYHGRQPVPAHVKGALERLMGLLLTLVSVQMFLDGVASYLKGGN